MSLSEAGTWAIAERHAGMLFVPGSTFRMGSDKHYPEEKPADRGGGIEGDSYDPRQPQLRIPRKVVKGGPLLCAPNDCRRYRPAARHAQPVDTSMSHVGFRCIIREGDRP